jgi:chromosome segregation ATPase
MLPVQAIQDGAGDGGGEPRTLGSRNEPFQSYQSGEDEKGRSILPIQEGAGDEDLVSASASGGSATQGKTLKATQIDDSTNERTIVDLRLTIAELTQDIFKHQYETNAKDYQISLLTKAERELQTLCSTMEEKVDMGEKMVADLTEQLRRLEEESVSKNAQIISLTEKNEAWDASVNADQEATILHLTGILKTQSDHIDLLFETNGNWRELLDESYKTIDRLNTELEEKISTNNTLEHRILPLSQENEDLTSACNSEFARSAAMDEENIAQLKLNIAQFEPNLAEDNAGVDERKEMLGQSLSLFHQPLKRMGMGAPASEPSIHALIVAEKDRKIAELKQKMAELNDKLSECYSHLLATQQSSLVEPSWKPPRIAASESEGDCDEDTSSASHKSAPVPSTIRCTFRARYRSDK